jgi:hypothetical protein
MSPYLRLRQICLVAPHLEPVVGDIADILGLQVCYRDAEVAKYGLENALLPVETTLLEVVAPTEPGTAAGRFLDKSQGRGGYMAIFCCDDPDARARHAEGIGVRTANVIDHAPYHGVQLHPRDCRAAFIEFNHTVGSDDVRGPYPPAGPDWSRAIRNDVTEALLAVELQSPDPWDLARHWASILQLEAREREGGGEIALPNATMHFVKGAAEALTALTFKVRDVDAVGQAARDKGLDVHDNVFRLAGVQFRVVA